MDLQSLLLMVTSFEFGFTQTFLHELFKTNTSNPDIELVHDGLNQSNTTKKQLGQRDNLITPDANLTVFATIDPSRVPLWLTCGPSIRVLTECETTATILLNLFQREENEALATYTDEEIGGDFQSKRALLVTISQAKDEMEHSTVRSKASELVIYGVWKYNGDNEVTQLAITDGSTSEEVESANSTSSFAIFALPLSSYHGLLPSLSFKPEPDSTSAMFLTSDNSDNNFNHEATQSARKRKSDMTLDNIVQQAKRGRRAIDLPPGLQRPVNFTGRPAPKLEHFSFPRSKNESTDYDAASLTGFGSSGDKRQFSEVDDTTKSRSMLKRSSSSISFLDRDREQQQQQQRPQSSRFPSCEPSVVSIYPNLLIPEHKQRHRSVTRPPDSNLSFLERQTSVSNSFIDRNKPILQKLIMANLTSFGLSRKKGVVALAGGNEEEGRRAQDEDDEYKLIYHTMFKSVTFALRKRWDVDYVDSETMKELVSVFGRPYVTGRADELKVKKEEEEDDP